MNKEIKEFIWQICQYLQPGVLVKLTNDDLTALFQQVFSLDMLMKSVDFEPVEKQVVADCLDKIIAEIRRRDIKVKSMPIEVIIDVDGAFVKGKEELRHAFAKLSFDEMMDFVDSILANPLNEAQRMAIIDLARDKVYTDATAN